MRHWFLVGLLVAFSYGRAQVPDLEISGINSMASECATKDAESGMYTKLTPSSKYLTFQPKEESESGYSFDEAEAKCQEGGLELGEVTHMYDYESLLKNSKDDALWIGLNQRSQVGHWYHSNGGRAKLQMFVGMEPNNIGNDEKCVILRTDKTDEEDKYLYMEDVNCKSAKAGILCQFPKDDKCYKESAEEAVYYSNDNNKTWFEVVESTHHISFGKQKTWMEARQACLMAGRLQLATFSDPDSYSKLIQAMKPRLKAKHLAPGTQFWTAGQFATIGPNFVMNFKTGSEGNKWAAGEDDISVSHQWAPATKEAEEPYDQAGSGREQCLDISFESPPNKGKAPYWRASNCHLPKYFICELVDNTVPRQVIADLEPGTDTDDPNSSTVNCDNSDSNSPLEFNVSLETPETQEDVINFIMYSVEHDLGNGNNPIEIRKEIEWKKELIDILFAIAKKVIHKDYVDPGMLNVAKFVNLQYQDAAKSENESAHENVWKKQYTRHFEKCLNTKAARLKLKGTGFEVSTIEFDGKEPVEALIIVPEENADSLHTLDVAIDIFWYVFSLSLATCYDTVEINQLPYASDIHVQFVKDFIAPMRKRWTISVAQASRGYEDKVDHTYVLGDIDYPVNYRNLRFAVTAAYMDKDIDELLQLVRPLDMTTVYSSVPMPFENGKTGRNLY